MKWGLTLLFLLPYLTYLDGQTTEASSMADSVVFHIGHHPFCGPIEGKSQEQKLKEAVRFVRWRQATQNQFANARSNAPIRTIPVVFHLLEDVPGITDDDVIRAVASLNNAYTHSNKYPNGQDFSMGTRGVDTRIEFCLAQRAPDGGVTNGIVRWETDYARMDVDMEDAKLKTQGQWDPRRYLNIWIVSNGLDAELDRDYSGRTSWDRTNNLGGYSGGPGGVVGPDARQDGVIAVGLGAALLAHEIGHYMSLAHTFSASCANNDCLVDGDGICDTPPDISQAGCNQNTCDTDTLSNYSNGNFTTDVPDMTSNFMDYSSCPSEFTQGQADRMLFTIDNFRVDLPVEAPSNNMACVRPCNADFNISFAIDERYREPNVPYNFTSSITGTATVDTYEWYVERLGNPRSDYTIAWLEGYTTSTPVVANTPNLQYSFPDVGKYRVYLKAWNSADPSCYTSYSRTIRVTCLGVDSRFTPNVRFIAAKQPGGKMIDSVFFMNRSVNATDYEWTVRHEPYDNMGPAQPLFNSTDVDLNYTFLEPGDYFITLIAKNGPTCADTIGPYRLPVADPTIDGVLRITQVDCYKEDSIRVAFQMWNDGYDTIRVGMPVTFYDEDPRNATPVPNVLGTYYLDKEVYGRDRRENFVAIVPASKPKLDQIWAVFNVMDNQPLPITWPTPDLNVMSINSEFPPTGHNELDYGNNFASRRDFQFRVNLAMTDSTACKFTDVQLQADHINGRTLTGIEWLPDTSLSCRDCLAPFLSLRDEDVIQTVVLTSQYFCTDTASLAISVIKEDIPLPTINAPSDFCPQADSIDLAGYVNGQQLRWYDTPTGNSFSPNLSAMQMDVPGVFSYWVSQTINGCEGPRANFTYTVMEPPQPPTVAVIPDICEGDVPPDIASFVTGTDLIWYELERGGVGSDQIPVVSGDQTGTYQYWVSRAGASCESERVEIGYTIHATPEEPLLAMPMELCVGDPIPDLSEFLIGEGLRWYESPDAEFGSDANPQIFTDTAQTYRFWVNQNMADCPGPRIPVDLTVWEIEVIPGGPYEVVEGNRQSIEVDVSTYPQAKDFYIEWLDEAGTVVGTESTLLTIFPTAPTFYTARVDAGICVEQVNVEIDVISLIDPTQIFSPNGDGLNDTWHIGGIEQYPNADLRVYNRWGSVVYQAKQYQNDWMGTWNDGKDLPVATYYFVIDLNLPGADIVTGSVTIIR